VSIWRVTWWQDRLYGGPNTGRLAAEFLRMVERYLDPSLDVLDLGAGSGLRNAYDFKGRARRMVGVDLDPRVRDNPLLDEGVVGSLTDLPFEDASFDLAFSMYVLEHVADPPQFVREVRRVLRPGGVFLALTPNRNHYVPLLASILSERFQKWYNKKRGRDEEDTFPTVYRLNTLRDLKTHFRREDFVLREFRAIEVQPRYLSFCVPAFLLGAAYERIVNATERLAGLRVNLMCAFEKRSHGED